MLATPCLLKTRGCTVENSDNPNKIPFEVLCSSSQDIPYDDTAGSGPLIPLFDWIALVLLDPSFSSGAVVD